MPIFKYGNDPLNTYKEFQFDKSFTQNIIFIHGGGWRDINNTFDDFSKFAQELIEKKLPLNIFGINYRLSPQIQHPCHLNDVIDAVNHIHSCYNLQGRMHFIGHSVGATLILQMITQKQVPKSIVKPINFRISTSLLIDGIFSIRDLLLEYPQYTSMVDTGFQSIESAYEATEYSIAEWQNVEQLVIIQSTEDELLSMKQTNSLIENFRANGFENYIIECGKWGKHEEVYRQSEVVDLAVQYICTV